MEVTKTNFRKTLPLVEQSINRADFLVIDAEFTGLLNGRNARPLDTPEEYYKSVLEGASEFLLIQFGLVAFYWDEETGEYRNDAYNFYLFPKVRPGPERVFSCQSSSIDFLASQGFDFNKLFHEGIPYLTQPAEALIREKLEERQKTYNNTSDNVIPVPDENKEQIEEICGRVKVFSEASEPEELEIDRVNAFMRRLLFQEVAARFKGQVYCETKVLENKNRVLKITRVSTSDDPRSKEEERKLKEWEEVEEAVGFSRVARMISESQKLVIGHNMLLDVVHTLSHFFQPLPSDYASFKEFTNCMFPRILDTKYMSSLPPFKDKVTSSVLPHLLATLSEKPFSVPTCKSEEGRGYCRKEDKSHEAGFDAYITGLCFLAMYRHLANMRGETPDQKINRESAILKPFLNKIFLAKTAHYDSPYINLAGKDSDPSRDHVFHIKFPSDWVRNDLVQLFSPFGPITVQWLDDVSALVCLMRKELARQAARTFSQQPSNKYSITTYAKYKMAADVAASGGLKHWLSKGSLEAYRKRIQLASSQPIAPEPSSQPTPESSTRPTPSDEAVSSTTATSLAAPTKVARKRTASTSSAEAKGPQRPQPGAGRNRTSSGVFEVADAEPSPRREDARPVKRTKTEAIVPSSAGKLTTKQRYRQLSVASSDNNSDSDSSPKKPKTIEFDRSPAAPKCVSAFEESDNWD